MMPSIGVSSADATTQTAGGSPIFSPSHLFGRSSNSSRQSTSWDANASSEATAKTDMGGGLLGGLGGGGEGGGGILGSLGGLGATIASLFKKPAVALTDEWGLPTGEVAGGGPNWPIIAAIGAAVTGLAVLMFLFRK